jgi:CRISPR-associated protein Cas1
MATLYVTEPLATVRLRREALEVEVISGDRQADPMEADGAGTEDQPVVPRPPRQVELHRLEAVALVGRVHITVEALRTCVERGIAVALLDRAGRFEARLTPESSRSADLRMKQYAVHLDLAGRLRRAAEIVAAKARNGCEVLIEHQSNDSANAALPMAIAALKDQAAGARAAGSLESLLGYEGAAARTYFQALATVFRGPITFPGRKQRPSPDPANALLSLGYTLLGSLLTGRLEARGLDPALGFFHEIHPGRPSLALDLLEELRHPIVDRFVVRACNLRIFRPEHFEPDPDRPGGVRLIRSALKRYFLEWEKHLLRPVRDAEPDGFGPGTAEPGPRGGALPPRPASGRVSVGTIMDRQIERLVGDLRGGPTYRPFRYGG